MEGLLLFLFQIIVNSCREVKRKTDAKMRLGCLYRMLRVRKSVQALAEQRQSQTRAAPRIRGAVA